jgi:transcription initiation factor TFIIIB Brf1 subunit/transcription initiation factor TFIIB
MHNCPHCNSTRIQPDKENPGEAYCLDCGAYFVINDARNNFEDDMEGYDDD